MKFKTNLVVGAIFIALLAFVYIYEIKGGEDRRKEAERSKQLLDIKESEVQLIAVVRGDTTIVITKNNGDWQLSSPVVDRADADAVERYVRNIAEAEREKVVADSAAGLEADVAARYGLVPPRLKVLLATQDGALDTLLFGADTPTDRYTYVKQSGANPEIFAVRAWRFDNLNKGIFDLRNRRIVDFAKEDVAAARRRGMGGELALAKEDGQWRLSTPVAARAATDAVESLLTKIESSQVESFVAEDPAPDALKEYGLAPVAGVEWTLVTGNGEKRLLIGRDDGEGRYFARAAERLPVFLVDSTLVQKLTLAADELRDKKPLRLKRDAITAIELRHANELVVQASKDSADVWSLVAPEQGEAKSWRLNSLLTDLGELEAVAFAQAAAGDLLLSIRLSAGEQTLHWLRFYHRDGEIFLEQNDDAASYRISSDDFAEIDIDLDEVRPQRAAADSAAADE
jgi:hypothetical protein